MAKDVDSEERLEMWNAPTVIEAIFIEAIYWSLGASLVEAARDVFDAEAKKLAQLTKGIDDETNFARAGEVPQNQKLWYDYHLDTESDDFNWKPWKFLVKEYSHNVALRFNEILVPTVDTTRTEYLLMKSSEIKRPIVLVGESGTSKSATIDEFLRKLDKDAFAVLPINFSSRTCSMDVQRNLEANIEKRTKDTFGPPPGPKGPKRLMCFIDDMNMPQVDTYGTQQPIALLKLLLEKGGFYDRGKELGFKHIKDISYMAAMGKAGGGRNSTDPRFLSLFTVINMTFPNDESLRSIYSSILAGKLQDFNPEIQALTSKITECTLAFYDHCISTLPPTPSKFHYIFNLRDLSRVYHGFFLATPDRFKTCEQFIRLWKNECLRVFYDRLINEEDKTMVMGFIEGLIESNFDKKISEFSKRLPLLFGDYRTALLVRLERF